MTHDSISEIRDLAEFCERWQSLRHLVSKDSLDETIHSPQTRSVVEWLVLLADRACTDFDHSSDDLPTSR